MPYIKQDLREELSEDLNALKLRIMSMIDDPKVDRAGILNYVITDMLDTCYGPLSDAKYRDYNEAIGMLECCKLEFYRKAAAPYEDIKEKQNGKVLDGGINRNAGFGLVGKDLTRQQPIPAYSFEHGLNRASYPVGTSSEEFKYMRELIYQVDSNESDVNGKVVFKAAINKDLTIFILSGTLEEAEGILNKWIKDQNIVNQSVGHVGYYKKFGELELEVKNAFLAPDNVKIPNFILFTKNKNRSSKKGDE